MCHVDFLSLLLGPCSNQQTHQGALGHFLLLNTKPASARAPGKEKKQICKDSLARWWSGKEYTYQCRRGKKHRFNLWVQKIPLEEEMATHSSLIAWKTLQTKEPDGLYSPGGNKESDMTKRSHTHTHTHTHTVARLVEECKFPEDTDHSLFIIISTPWPIHNYFPQKMLTGC